MATPSEKLAASLHALKVLQDEGKAAIKTSELTRADRERLVKNGFLFEITRGWYLSTPSSEKLGDSTTWYVSFWHFCSRYLGDRFPDEYWLSPEQSLQIHSGNWAVPKQLIVRSKVGTNSITPLAHDTSLFSMKSALPNEAVVQYINGLRVLSLPSALVYSASTIFVKSPTDVRTGLAMISDSSEVLKILLDGGHSTIAGRLCGAFRNIGNDRVADDILKTMKAAGYDIREVDPFRNETPVLLSSRDRSPFVNRIKLMWAAMREVVIKNFPAAPGIPADSADYLRAVEDIYTTDAYHSLSIERYKVTPDLIEKVKEGEWNIESNEEDRKQRDAMAARGYWQATQEVRKTLKRILAGENAGQIADSDHANWYRELFAPSVTAGILKPSDLAGYRSGQVFIGKSKHIPLAPNDVRDAMPVLFELISQEPDASVRAVLGHFILVYIHPYMDGNGRMGRFMLNVMLASGGYPWTVIPVEKRDEYMSILERASVENDILPFTKFIAHLVKKGMNGKPVAHL
ncbi:MAG: Fic family protein [Flavobacteriales bacterium]|jgi:fido (protein-threonine AMPylation protein)